MAPLPAGVPPSTQRPGLARPFRADVPLQTSQPVAAGKSVLTVSPRQNRRDRLSLTYHDAGTLAMDEDPALPGANADL